MEGLSREEKDTKRAREKEKRGGKRSALERMSRKGRLLQCQVLGKAKWKTNKAPKALKDKKDELHKEESAMAEIARKH